MSRRIRVRIGRFGGQDRGWLRSLDVHCIDHGRQAARYGNLWICWPCFVEDHALMTAEVA